LIVLLRVVPVVVAVLAVVFADALQPRFPDAWGVAMLPAAIIGTWLGGWRGGAVAIALGMAGALALLDPPPFAWPARTMLWLIAHSVAIVVVDLARQAGYESREARTIRHDQAARAARAIAERRAAFLAHASEVLARARDYQSALAEVANLAVPQIADLCVVDIVRDDGAFTALAVAHADPEKVRLVKELRQLYPLDPAAKFGPPRVLRTGCSQVFSEVQDAAGIDPSIASSESRVAQALGIHSTMAVPLLVGGRRLGVISLATTDSGRRFVADDLRFAEDLARRAAIAIDTAAP
jgi:transcriptional regulator with GAF, ATPase, and Fis domain